MSRDLTSFMLSIPASLALTGARQATGFLEMLSRGLAGGTDPAVASVGAKSVQMRPRFRADGGSQDDMAIRHGDELTGESFGGWTIAPDATAKSFPTNQRHTWDQSGAPQLAVPELDLQTYRDGEWYVMEQVTRKPFQRLKGDATRALLQGLSGLVTVHNWDGNCLMVSSFGSEARLEYRPGHLICRVRFRSFPSTIGFVQRKILSDVASAMREVSGATDIFNRNVFIVHGRDHRPRTELKEFLLGLGLNPVVLEEEHDMGMTVPQKLEYYASLCSFAFIIVTPDDLIAPAKAGMIASSGAADVHQWRPRQNVIMELGWFMAYLGLDRIAILYKDGTEIPSDLHGILYVRFENSVLEASVCERIRKRLEGVYLVN